MSIEKKFIIVKDGGGGHRPSEQLEGVPEKNRAPLVFSFSLLLTGLVAMAAL